MIEEYKEKMVLQQTEFDEKLDTRDWVEIELVDGKSGWIYENQIRAIH